MLTSQSVHKSNRGKVVAVGFGQRLKNGEQVVMDVTVNDVVILNDGYWGQGRKNGCFSVSHPFSI